AQERGRTAGTEHGARSARAEGGARIRALAPLEEHQRDNRHGKKDMAHCSYRLQHLVIVSAAQPAARQMPAKPSTSREAPPTIPPSTSGIANSSAALADLTLPPYSTLIKSAMLPFSDRNRPRIY